MRFMKKLITPVLAAVLLVGGAAFAQEAIIASDGEVRDAGLFWWQYDEDTGEFRWGAEECMSTDEDGEEGVDTTGEATEDPLAEDTAETDAHCYTLDLTEPRNADETATDEDEGDDEDDTELNHGDLVSRVAHQVKDLDEEGLLDEDTNRGSIISQLARETKDLFDDDEDGDDAELESEDVDDEDDDDHDDEDDEDDGDHDKEPPGKAKGKDK